MISYSTTTSVGVTDKFKKAPTSALEYVKGKQSQDVPSKLDFINVLQVEVHSQVDREQMSELINSIYPELTDILGDSEKIGLMIKIGKDTIKSLISREDEFESVRKSIMREYVSLIELPTIINKGSNKKPNLTKM